MNAATAKAGDTALTLAANLSRYPLDILILYPLLTRGPALTLAANLGSAEIVELLLDAGADLEAKNKRGWTAVMSAVDGGRKSIVRLLLSRGASANAAAVKTGWTALMAASSSGFKDISKMLVGAGADVNAVQTQGWSPLHIAAQVNSF